MVLLRPKCLLTIAALAVAISSVSAAAQAADSVIGNHKQAQREVLGQEVGQIVAQAITRAKSAAGRTTQLRTASFEATTYTPALVYHFPEKNCSRDAYQVEYFDTWCTTFEEGVSIRFNCISDDTSTQLQVLTWTNGDCSGEPSDISTPRTYTVGGCDVTYYDGAQMECSSELKYGMDNAVMWASYPSNTCDKPFYAMLAPYGCDGYGWEHTCSGGTLYETVYREDDCSGAVLDEEPETVDVCNRVEAGAGVFDDKTSYTMTSCSADNIFDPPTDDPEGDDAKVGDDDKAGDDDSAPRTMFSWFGAVVASATGYVLATLV